MTRSYKVGDIVKEKGTNFYFIVASSVRVNPKDDENDGTHAQYSLYPIYPATHNGDDDEILALHNDLMPIARHDEHGYANAVEVLIRMRNKNGVFVFSEKVENLLIEKLEVHGAKLRSQRNTGNSKEKVNKDVGKEFEKMMSDDTNSKKMAEYTEMMDEHLDLLNKAIKDGDKNQIEINKHELEAIRKVLMELEYFSLNKRRKGAHTRVKL